MRPTVKGEGIWLEQIGIPARLKYGKLEDEKPGDLILKSSLVNTCEKAVDKDKGQ